MTEVRHTTWEWKSLLKLRVKLKATWVKTNWVKTSGQESEELEDSERLVQFDGFYEDQTVYIYLVTRTMSLNPFKDSMSIQNVILKTTG